MPKAQAPHQRSHQAPQQCVATWHSHQEAALAASGGYPCQGMQLPTSLFTCNDFSHKGCHCLHMIQCHGMKGRMHSRIWCLFCPCQQEWFKDLGWYFAGFPSEKKTSRAHMAAAALKMHVAPDSHKDRKPTVMATALWTQFGWHCFPSTRQGPWTAQATGSRLLTDSRKAFDLGALETTERGSGYVQDKDERSQNPKMEVARACWSSQTKSNSPYRHNILRNIASPNNK